MCKPLKMNPILKCLGNRIDKYKERLKWKRKYQKSVESRIQKKNKSKTKKVNQKMAKKRTWEQVGVIYKFIGEINWNVGYCLYIFCYDL